MVLDDRAQECAIVECTALKQTEGEHEIEAAERLGGEGCDVSLVKRDIQIVREARACSRDRRGTVVDADDRACRRSTAQECELVAGVATEREHARPRGKRDAGEGLAQIEDKSSILALVDPRERRIDAVLLRARRAAQQPVAGEPLEAQAHVGRREPPRRTQAQRETLGEVEPRAQRPVNERLTVDVDRLACKEAGAEVRVEGVELDGLRASSQLGLDVSENLEHRHARGIHRVKLPRNAVTVPVVAELVTYTLENKVAVITMDDGKANALSTAMIDALLAALVRAQEEASAVVLAGRADRFCAGFDLRVMMSGPDNAKSLLRAGSKLLLELYGLSVPLVIACTGHALAGGALVVLTGDVRMAAAGEFKIGLNEVSLGMPVPVLAMELARDRLVKTELTHATLLGRIYNPQTAAAAGYVDAVVASDALLDTAKAEAARLGALARSAFKATKVRLRGRTIEYIRATMDADMTDLMMPTA